MEHIVRQEATAIFVAVTLLGRNDMSLPMIINTFIGMAVGIPFVTWLRTRAARLDETSVTTPTATIIRS